MSRMPLCAVYRLIVIFLFSCFSLNAQAAACVISGQAFPDWTFNSTDNISIALNGNTGTLLETGGTGDMNLVAVQDSMSGTNYPDSFFTPAPSSCVEWVTANVASVTSATQFTLQFAAPITNPRFHFLNFDNVAVDFTGTQTTTSGSVAVNRLSGNNEFEVVGAQVNDTVRSASNSGCEANDGSNANGACGTVQLTGTYQTILLTFNVFGSDGVRFTVSKDYAAYPASVEQPFSLFLLVFGFILVAFTSLKLARRS